MLLIKKYLKCFLLPAMLLAFCNDGGDDGTSGPGTTGPVTTSGETVGVFTISIDENKSEVSALGTYNDGSTPRTEAWDEVMKDGDMVLLTPRNFSCVPACTSGYKCVEGDSCVAEPSRIDVGNLTLTGMTVKGGAPKTFTLKAIGRQKVYAPVDELAYPQFTEGADVTLSSTGSESMAPFALSVKGIPSLEIINQTITLEKGKPIKLEWVAPTADINSVVEVLINITFHGGTKAKILGETADDGELTINAPILDKLREYGLAGFPRIDFTRKVSAYDETTRTKLVAESFVSYELTIPGVHSCTDDLSECPADMGYTNCNEITRLCE